MQIISSITEYKTLRAALSSEQSIGFVPTMGNLHEGHAALIKRSVSENDFTVLSVFINPTQFNDKNDFEHYPKTAEADIKLATSLGVDCIFMPPANEIYPDGFTYRINESAISTLLEGHFRPGHFDGMLSVVMKLFMIIKPHCAYFGEKDYQQLLLVQKMVEAFFLDIEIIPCPTIRRPSGLPLSSRNQRLNAQELAFADQLASLFHSTANIDDLRAALKQNNITFDYLEKWQNRLLWAIKIGSCRIIDNREFS